MIDGVVDAYSSVWPAIMYQDDIYPSMHGSAVVLSSVGLAHGLWSAPMSDSTFTWSCAAA
jgi:hypothetical protein